MLPATARVVVIGGGVAGCSIAYHLARLGWTDVVLVEQHELTEGTTWHSAGFVGQLRSTISQTRMIMYSSGLYAELRERTGLDPGWRGVGGLRLATTAARVEELRRQASSATTYGLDMDLLGPAETVDRLPLLNVADVRLAGWLPGDGWLEPAQLAEALAAGARSLGVRIVTGTRVTGISVSNGRVSAVETPVGRITTEVVVNAAGAAAGQVGLLAGVDLPIVPIKHQYVVSDTLGMPTMELPTVRDPDRIVYFRGGDETGLLVGGYVRDPSLFWPASMDQPRTLFEPDMPKFTESWENARHRVPTLRDLGIARVVHGPEAFTPDGEFLLGETPVAGLWVAAGFCVHGLAAAGGVGKVMAEWIVDGTPEYDVSTMDVRRFGGHAASRRWASTKAIDGYSRYYDVVYPGQEWQAARPLRRSAVWPRLGELDAALGEKAGWERANWFGVNAGLTPQAQRPKGWAGRYWSPAIAGEVAATTSAAGLFDQSSFAKLDVRGPGALALLNHLCANEIDRPVGSLVYTQLLNARGGIEADLTVTRLGEQHFRVVTSTACGVRDADWIRKHATDDVLVDDVTGAYGCLCLWGPAARDILQPLTDASLSNADFPFMRARRLTVGHVPVLAQRVTYVGELGWELYASTEYVLTLWDTLSAAGQPLGLRPAGYRAIDSMRLEKGYRVWGSDLTTDTDPFAAGLGSFVRLDKPFLGRDALTALRSAGGPSRVLRCLVLDDPGTVCLGSEPVRVAGVACGRVTSGGFGYRVGASIAYAYLPAEVEVGTPVEVSVFDRWIPAVVRTEPLYDPKMLRVRA
ncbi:FAD-dependent oxidoreductase [Dactylosporangium sp. AC04546]|uniref:GcvT family protein n=1 Tax=Dactylosporangium sp. AC04546 TaxID=2862460 RepID=UPI001EDF1D60|nr:FAD-dependent oxidoreductase [Dactylosporangium sp. AC04546]WVK85288.1 FAD-dependent oxidoreductase [Dactylosporangium sp. AC04546]